MEIIQLLIGGIANGCVYGLIALGFVLIYKSSEGVNFAQGDMMMFGAFYFILPRLTGREWPSATLIRVHFWCSAFGIAVYFLALTAGGVQQGLLLLDPGVPFLEVVQATLPWLQARSWAGLALTIAHIAFAISVAQMVLGLAPARGTPTLLASRSCSQGGAA